MKFQKCAKAILTISIFFSFYSILNAGQDCRSMLNGFITPLFGSEHFVGGIEVSAAFAGMTDRNVKNGLIIGGLGYNFNEEHQLYIEGAYKNFYNSAGGPGRKGKDSTIGGFEQFAAVDKKNWGFREIFYKYNGEKLKISAGLQTLKLDDYFLVDERVIGLNTSYQAGNFTFSLTGASVMAQFARYADFCGTRHVYNLTRGGRVDFLGDEFGKSNFFSASVKWENKTINNDPESQTASAESSEEDEFEEFTEITTIPEKPFLSETGLIFYEEFGDAFPDYKYYGGIFAKFNLPLELNLKTEVLYQNIYKENAVGYYLDLNRIISFENGDNTIIGASMLGKIELDDNTMFYPAYTNLFMGEVMKMDALELPVAQFYAKHSFAALGGLNLKLQYANQLEDSHTQELDIELGLKFLKHFKVSVIGGYINSLKLKQEIYFGRIETRIAI